MIGGRDTVVKARDSAKLREHIHARFKRLWPDLVRVDVDDYAFFYENQAADDSWTDHGRTDENDVKMACVIAGENQLTIVGPDDDESRLAKAIAELAVEIERRFA